MTADEASGSGSPPAPSGGGGIDPDERRAPDGADVAAEWAPHSAGFSKLTLGQSVRRGGIKGAIWYPARAREAPTLEGVRVLRVARDAMPVPGRFPLVVLSHDSGGGHADHHGTAEHLARRGYVVVAITHPGDNEQDLSGVLGPEQLLGRCRHLSRAIDHVLSTHKYARIVDGSRIAGLGCGVGAYALIVLAGGVPDFRRFAAGRDRGAHAELLPHWEALVARIPHDVVMPADPRLGAAVLLAPNYTFLFDAEALADLTLPLMLYEQPVPPGEGEGLQRFVDWLPRAPERHYLELAHRHAFVAGCAPAFAADHPELAEGQAEGPGGFDRAAFHRRLNAAVLDFLGRSLGREETLLSPFARD
jgi:predicted dienelactone hydrolase